VASRSIFSLFSPDEEVLANSLLWKNLPVRACPAQAIPEKLKGEAMSGQRVRRSTLPVIDGPQGPFLKHPVDRRPAASEDHQLGAA
jgi:hypothetical protein